MLATKIDLGCSVFKKEGYVGIDIYNWSSKYPKDEFICGPIPDILSMFTDNSIEEVRASHLIEHISQDRVIETFNEIYRILKVDGIFEIYVPPTTGRGAFCDPTHKSFWNDWSFRYYDKSFEGWWLLESYGIKCNFKQIKIEHLDEMTLHVILQKIC